MASSGSYDWNPNTYQIITGALRLLGAIQTGESPPAEEYEDALASLNGLITHFQATGIHVWSEVDCTLFLQQAQFDYQIGLGTTDHCAISTDCASTALASGAASGDTTITVMSAAAIGSGQSLGVILDSGMMFWTTAGVAVGNVVPLLQAMPGTAAANSIVVNYVEPVIRPLRVPAGRRYRLTPPGGHAIETPMGVLSRIDYGMIPNKSTPGIPTQFFFDPQLGLADMHVWPAPTSAIDIMKFTAQRPLQNFVTQRDTADIPVEWISALRYNLAVELAPEYDCPAERFQIIATLAAQKVQTCAAWDREPESVYFGLERFPATRN